MKFIIQRDRLVQSVQDVMKAVTTRTTIPILTGIKITATSEGLPSQEVIQIFRLNLLFLKKMLGMKLLKLN
jgi:predicted DNA binding CopG/RHH family protein